MSKRPLIALVTDFGTRDPYVAEVKCVLAAMCDAEIVDFTHEIAPFDVFEAAIFVRGVWESFAAMRRCSVLIAVVDPGVGTERRILAIRDRDSFLLAPDNGLAHPLLKGTTEIRSIENASRFLPERSATFHGRDRFAPVAGALANGFPFEKLGSALPSAAVVPLRYQLPVYGSPEAIGTVIAIDRFGNVITDLRSDRISLEGLSVLVGAIEIRAISRTYAEAPESEPFVIPGSRGTLEIAVRNGSAAALLQTARGDRVVILFEQPQPNAAVNLY
ncbi:MAG TPA: SAM-dependent chlorinase/fluorinase [Thermoanaerobaculia bacterium]|nr:SAM-dependent chlorinase/fluorinase [Thermoanaerobaculia bacterium]